jgi:alpha-mannosidase
MTLSVEQRLDSLDARLNVLSFWGDRAFVDLRNWTFNGEPWLNGQPWPSHEGIAVLSHPEVTIPPGWALEPTRLDLNLGGEGLLRIRSAGGEEAWGLDAFHRRFPLRHASFSLAVQAVPRLPFGIPNRDARLEWARLVLLEPAVLRLNRQLRLILETGRALRRHEAVEPLIGCAERALASLHWPSDTAIYVSRTAKSQRMLELWEPPQQLNAHPEGLNPDQQQTVVAASEQLGQELKALRERYPPQGALAVTGQAHLDLAWLWPMDETRRKGRRTSSTVIGLMERYPEFKFNMTSAQLYAFIEEDDPDLFRQISERIGAGQWESIGGMWVEPDLNMPTGESLVRQLLYGQRYFQQRFGSTHAVTWLPDCFGFTPALPQLLRSAGIESFFTAKLNWSEMNKFPYDLFWWEGLDGSRVLAHAFDNPILFESAEPGIGGYNGKPDPFSTAMTWQNYRGKHLYPESLFSIGYGDGGGGPSVEMLEDMRELANFPVLPALRFSMVREFYERVRNAITSEDLPVWSGELYLELHRGTLTSQGRTKYLHRRAERDLIAAETLAAMNALLGDDRSVSLESLWHLILRNEFHDILPGSSIHVVYETANAELGMVVDTARQSIHDQLGVLAERIVPKGSAPALLAVNPDLSPRPLRLHLTHEVPGGQAVEDGYVLTGPETVPALGACVVFHTAPSGELEVSPRHLENNFLRVTLAEDGSLSSVYHKRHPAGEPGGTGREILAGRGNQLWAYVDVPRNWDAWDIEAGYERVGEELSSVESVTVIESGPHRAAIHVERRFRNSRIRQDIRLWANSARLEFRTTLDWHDRHVLLKARFPLAIRTDHATFETAFGVVRRPTSRNTSWESAQFEVAGHRFADLSEPGYGAALLNDGKYGYDARGHELGLSLVRSPTFPDPYADEGIQIFTYALYPHGGGWLEGGVLMEAEDLNRPLLTLSCAAERGALCQVLKVSGLPLGLGTLKALEDGGGMVLRAYEPHGARGTVQIELPPGWTLESELDVLEREIGAPDMTFGPFQVHSWLLRRTE